MPYDLLIKGGHVLDPGRQLDGVLDIAIEHGVIKDVGANISTDGVAQVLDVSGPGRYVIPGLIDLHTHVAHGAQTAGVGMECCDPDAIGVESGVTTVVDCGSVGVAAMGVFPNHILPKAATRTICYSNVAMFAHTFPGMADMRDVDDLDDDALRKGISANPGLIEGLKLRLVGETARAHGKELVDRSTAMAGEHDLPLMVHIGDFGIDTAEHRSHMGGITNYLLEQMKPGDIITHLCTPNPGGVLDAAGAVLPTLQEARDRGVVLDPALGMGNFGYRVAEELAQRGFHPDTISSDLTAYGMSFHSLLECMAKFMAIGYTLPDVVKMATVNPAKAIAREDSLGSIAVGREADISIIELVEGDFQFTDTAKETFHGQYGLIPVQTVRAGKLHAPRWGTHPWGWLPATAEG